MNDREPNAKIVECGNGLPSAGAYVPGEGELYLVVQIVGPIHTAPSFSGGGNYVYAIVELADWDDCGDDDRFVDARVELVQS